MSAAHVPTKALVGALLLGVATLAVAKMVHHSARLRVDADSDADAYADASDVAWHPSGRPLARNHHLGVARAPYADGLLPRSDEASRLPGTTAPVAAAKRGDAIGEPFSAHVVGEIEPSAGNKGGLGGGGR